MASDFNPNPNSPGPNTDCLNPSTSPFPQPSQPAESTYQEKARKDADYNLWLAQNQELQRRQAAQSAQSSPWG